jgi:hypothetical protein
MTRSFLFLLAVFLFFSCKPRKEKAAPPSTVPDTTINRQSKVNPYSAVDISPMDMTYFPVDYPKVKMERKAIDAPLARVIYSRPHLQGRHIFHEVLRYGQPWRLGANESTELDLYQPATIEGKQIAAGRYVLYCIPEEDHWTIVLNSNIDSWGLEPDPKKDIAKFRIPITTTTNTLEYFTIIFDGSGKNAVLLMAWDNVEARLSLSF